MRVTRRAIGEAALGILVGDQNSNRHLQFFQGSALITAQIDGRLALSESSEELGQFERFGGVSFRFGASVEECERLL